MKYNHIIICIYENIIYFVQTYGSEKLSLTIYCIVTDN